MRKHYSIDRLLWFPAGRELLKRHSPGFFGLVLVLAAIFGAFSRCSREKPEDPADYRLATEVTVTWNRLLLDLERHTTGYRPPVSARTFAYVELAAYETALPALEGYVSFGEFNSGFSTDGLPFPREHYCLPAGLNAAYARMARHFFISSPPQWLNRIDQLEADFARNIQGQAEKQSFELSCAYGDSTAEAVWRWSVSDSEGHNAVLYNYDKNYTPPTCAGCWKSDERQSMPALLPHWGLVRPFVVAPGSLTLNPPPAFDETRGSAFFTEAMEVLSVSQPLSKENLWIAEFWSDDLPGLTVTPAGRWISITNQAIEEARPTFPVVIETYLKTALALCDASIITWHGKYLYNVERPDTYIRRNIKPDWSALHDTPPFPSYPSGHSAFGAAAAEVLSAQLGTQFLLTDRTHGNRQEFVGKPRTYQSFAEMAKENAASRVLIGVHYRMDCEEGLRIGKYVGQKINNLPLRRKEAAVILPQ